jgi:hypothetical protein
MVALALGGNGVREHYNSQTDATGHTVISIRDAVGNITAVDLTFLDGTTQVIPEPSPPEPMEDRGAPS